MSGLYPTPYRSGQIQPVCEIGQNVLLEGTGSLFELYQVQFIEPLPAGQPITINLATTGLATLATTGATAISTQNQLDMNDGELGQFRFKLLDDIQVQLQQPQARGRNAVRNTQDTHDLFGQLADPDNCATEFYVLGQQRMYMIATNPTGYTIAQARVQFYGFRYVLRGLDDEVAGVSGILINPIKRFTSIKQAMEAIDPATNQRYRFITVPVLGWGG